MKKWLIFAVIAAMFAMVMFPACGKDEGGNAAAAENVRAYLIGGEVIVSWTGSANSDYIVYVQEKKINGEYSVAAETTIGQNQMKYVLATTGGVASPVRVNDNEEYWSVYSGSTLTGDVASANLKTKLPSGGAFRFGVGPANTGSFSLDEVPIVWDNENLTTDDLTGDKTGAAEKDYGFITFS